MNPLVQDAQVFAVLHRQFIVVGQLTHPTPFVELQV